MSHQMLLWGGFTVFVLIMLAIDLGLLHRKAHVVNVKEALRWSAVWIALALVFNIGLYFWYGTEPALAFLTGYVLEKSLSVDNLFVFLMIFSYFNVPAAYQHKVLTAGIIGALIMRAVMILVGTTLIQAFHWILYVFGGFLIFTGLKMAFQQHENLHPEQNPIVRLFTRFMPVTTAYHAEKFFVKLDGRHFATPLFLVLLMVEATDVVFALDSIPAVLAVTTDPFIVYTSNVFAILGLRALFFALAGLMGLFHYLRYGLALVLVFIGAKMLIADWYHLPVHWALAVVVGVLGLSVGASLIFPAHTAESVSTANLSPEA
ncbi:MAG: TerC family protein [Candidatus Tectomicrobia bacterium]|uniref:TerC family protein n=1 Tax=Tectimicrobiota bacterium TaxID=2528274 RepID=A0A938B4N3_UNCTE|nr:TerC family protein [Candidatus Tectomicrobia bacterium]